MSNAKLTEICESLLVELFGDGILKDPNFTETPQRMAKMYREMFSPCDLIDKIAKSIMDKSFPSTYRGMVILPNISTVSFCPHHMLPVEYTIIIGYIPNASNNEYGDFSLFFEQDFRLLETKLIGASKPERLACTLAKHPILQETYNRLIVQYIQESINPLGIAVIVKGQHSCMRIRGIKNACSNMITSEMTGAFKENHRTQAELFSLINMKI